MGTGMGPGMGPGMGSGTLPDGYRYVTSIDSNSLLETTHSLPAGQRPCLV